MVPGGNGDMFTLVGLLVGAFIVMFLQIRNMKISIGMLVPRMSAMVNDGGHCPGG